MSAHRRGERARPFERLSAPLVRQVAPHELEGSTARAVRGDRSNGRW
ncbi:hypothetical protein DB32_000112 [Sandaracinus amylolyticus]|uniref:Uncharacterized protein n=1 Tax=Sandaracinus amylolyticus TaxID=927083 RepID=A0A0F6SD77_9BACT|nr:hypothetical protein DB32_000112 [Sandaracinus amylolyticus]